MVNLSASYFSSVFVTPRVISETKLLPYNTGQLSFFPSHIFVKIEEVYAFFESLSNTQSSGPDRITVTLLYRCPDILSLPICSIINKSLSDFFHPSGNAATLLRF